MLFTWDFFLGPSLEFISIEISFKLVFKSYTKLVVHLPK